MLFFTNKFNKSKIIKFNSLCFDMAHTQPKIMQQHFALNLKISLAALVSTFILSATCEL